MTDRRLRDLLASEINTIMSNHGDAYEIASAVLDVLRDHQILVDLESPFAAATPQDAEANLAYARKAMRDSLLRGELPIASHLLYTQLGILDDTLEHERDLGIKAGKVWARLAQKTVVYADRGISRGMQYGITDAEQQGRQVEYRYLERAHAWTDTIPV